MANKDWTGNGDSIFRALGASNHSDKEREPHEFYATDPVALDRLSAVYPIAHKVWEPSCGQGHLSKWLVEHGHDVLSTDLIDRGYGIGGVDFFSVFADGLFNDKENDKLVRDWYLKDNPNLKEPFDILTNPPYNVSLRYVLHALDIIPDNGRVIMFVKTTFLEGKERREKIYDINPPRWVLQFSERVLCAKNGIFEYDGKRISSAVSYAFMVWNKHNEEKITQIKWI